MTPILSLEELKDLKSWIDDTGTECPDWLIQYAYYRWIEDIPYGTQTGDTGTVDEWLSDHVDSVENDFFDQLQTLQTKEKS